MKKYLVLIIAIAIGIFTRSYQYLERFNYNHDTDLAAWVVKDIVVDKHIRLIGQLTSSSGIYIGPLWYYLQIPFYLAGRMDPIYVPLLAIITGIAAIVSLYWVVTQIYGSKSGNIAALIYAASWNISSSEREVVPTAPVFLWSIWFLYALNLLLQGKKGGLLIIAVLWGLIWHIHLALIFSIPLVLGVLIYKHRHFKLKDFILPWGVLVLMSLPLLTFEARHNFGQLRSWLGIATHTGQNISVVEKSQKIILYSAKNANSIFWSRTDRVNIYALPVALLMLGAYLVKQKIISPSQATVYVLWWLAYLVIFSFNQLNLSEYYLHGFSILWIVILSVFLARLAQKQLGILVVVLVGFVIYNLTIVISIRPDYTGYLQKKQLVSHMVSDAKAHNYPCIAISYMTDPGRNLGYRYWFWLNNLHVNNPPSGSPVYTIVFPHLRAGSLDQTFGSLGLVYPDYPRYTQDIVDASCDGEDENLTQPMFGFTK